jgi:hypothetical protein
MPDDEWMNALERQETSDSSGNSSSHVNIAAKPTSMPAVTASGWKKGFLGKEYKSKSPSANSSTSSSAAAAMSTSTIAVAEEPIVSQSIDSNKKTVSFADSSDSAPFKIGEPMPTGSKEVTTATPLSKPINRPKAFTGAILEKFP